MTSTEMLDADSPPAAAIAIADPEAKPASGGLPELDFNPIFSTFRKRTKVAALKWTDIDYQVGKRHILKMVSGEASPGEFVAIMGPSGCGKTTLLNILAGRIQSSGRSKKLRGEITMNGSVIKPVSFRKEVAYVTQEDALFATATVRESLEFSARLRLPANTSSADREKIVHDIIESLGLSKCQDTMVGSASIRGVSGGERKRCAIGVELVSNPTLLFLDEPTSGLDSWSSFNVVNILKSIARTGCTVLCSIHQPSSEVYHTFDSLILLCAGTVLYQGSVMDVERPFNAKGLFFPPRTNVADYAMLLAQTLPLDKLPNNDKNEHPQGGERPVFFELATGDAAMTEASAPRGAGGISACCSSSSTSSRDEAKPGILVQAHHLMIREFKSIFRNKPGLFARFGGTAFLNVLFTILFIGAANQDLPGYSVQSHFGAVVQIVISAMFGSAQPAILTFPLERIIFIREKATGTYDTTPYMFAKLLVELPLLFLTALLSLVINYFAIGFRGSFFLLALSLWALMLASTSTAMVLGSMVTTPSTAQSLAPLLLVPQILFLGLFIRISQMPTWIAWAQYLCAAKYGLNLAVLVEFDPSLAINDQIKNEWAALLDYNLIYADLDWMYALILVGGIFAGFRVLSLIILSYKANSLGN